MTDDKPSFPHPSEPLEPSQSPAAQYWTSHPVPEPLPFSKQAIWGFVISCVSLIIFGFIGVIGVGLSARAFRAARAGQVRGRGLAIAGMIIGVIGFLYYAVVQILRLAGHL